MRYFPPIISTYPTKIQQPDLNNLFVVELKNWIATSFKGFPESHTHTLSYASFYMAMCNLTGLHDELPGTSARRENSNKSRI